jgi:DNA polymerase I-like protein with 3'-5' exonuclease and polymerase domains
MLKEIVHIQETAVECNVPLIVDVSEGKNWGECL